MVARQSRPALLKVSSQKNSSPVWYAPRPVCQTFFLSYGPAYTIRRPAHVPLMFFVLEYGRMTIEYAH